MAIPFGETQNAEPGLSPKALVTMIKNKFANLTDERTGKNTQYEISDAALSVLAVFFLQNPSFLTQQITLQKNKGKNNLQTLFGSYSNPSDNQIRSLLDAVSPDELDSIFAHIFNELHAIGYFKPFTVLDKSLLIALDGVEYFSSEKIHCDCCSTQEFANGKIRYSHNKVLYCNTFVTDYALSGANVTAGRSRWKIENENNNTLKTKGYHFEHNFGHGKKNLSSVLATLILLAFLFHTVLEHIDKCYPLLRAELPSRKTFFDDIRALTRYICFESWQQMLEFMLQGLEIPIPKSV